MATECIPNEGKDLILAPGLVGLPVNTQFLLSTKPIAWDLSNPAFGDFYSATAYADVGEIVGWTGPTAYARITVATPAPVNGIVTYTNINWDVTTAVDGPNNVRTLVARDPITGRIFFAWDLRLAVSTLTVGVHNLPVSPINVNSTAGFKAAGALKLNGQSLNYTGIGPTTFTGVTGGTISIPALSTVLQDAVDLSGPNQAQVHLSQVRLFAQNPGGT